MRKTLLTSSSLFFIFFSSFFSSSSSPTRMARSCSSRLSPMMANWDLKKLKILYKTGARIVEKKKLCSVVLTCYCTTPLPTFSTG